MTIALSLLGAIVFGILCFYAGLVAHTVPEPPPAVEHPLPKPANLLEPAPEGSKVPAGFAKVRAAVVCRTCHEERLLYVPLLVPLWCLDRRVATALPHYTFGTYCSETCRDVHTTQLRLETFDEVSPA